MQIAIISDIHDNIESLKKCLLWCRQTGIDELICCGDVCKTETLEAMADGFNKTIHLVAGNAELYEERELDNFDNIKHYGKLGYIEIDDKRVGFCHESFLIPKLKEIGTIDLVFYGHTHQPADGERDGVRAINPGTLGDRFMSGTFAFWNTDTGGISLMIIDNLNI